MRVEPLEIPGAFVVRVPPFVDERGSFTKLLHHPTLLAAGTAFDVRECYVTSSRRGVLRGMHYQAPPSDHVKLVAVVTGRAYDVLLDLRVGSPTFGQHWCEVLDASSPVTVIAPRGVAHGFLALSDDTRVLYACSTPHDAARDCGVLWSSCGVPWPLEGPPILSDRDRGHPPLAELTSPFRWTA